MKQRNVHCFFFSRRFRQVPGTVGRIYGAVVKTGCCRKRCKGPPADHFIHSLLSLRKHRSAAIVRRAAAEPVIAWIFDCFGARFSLSVCYGCPSRGRGLTSNQRFNKSPKGSNRTEPDRPDTAVRDRD